MNIQGHRGCRGLRPENTLEAFLYALTFPIQTLEMDVCMSEDAQVVVSHEPYMNALFSSLPTGEIVRPSQTKVLNLYTMPYSLIRQYDVGKRGNRLFTNQIPMPAYKPLLQEVLEVCEKFCQIHHRTPIHYNIEIKSESKEYGISQPASVAVFCDTVFEKLQTIPAERIIVQSFDFAILQYCHTQIQQGIFPPVRLSALVNHEGVKPSLAKLGFTPAIFSPYFKSLTQGKIALCHQKGMQVIPWTVNDPAAMLQLIQWKVDGLITDYPDEAIKLLASL